MSTEKRDKECPGRGREEVVSGPVGEARVEEADAYKLYQLRSGLRDLIAWNEDVPGAKIQALLDAVAGQPVSQGMVRDGEVIARLHNLDSHHNPHWSDEENRAYSLGVRNAIHVIEHPEEANQSAEAGQPRSVLAREGGER